jgi:hypothetical protein
VIEAIYITISAHTASFRAPHFRPIGLRTPRDLSRYFRDEVLRQAKVLYAEE